jgi:general secretion pathway protein G
MDPRFRGDDGIVRGSGRFHTSARISSDHGFTLVEMLVVLAIVGMLTALVGPQVMGYLGRAKVETAQAEIRNLETALDLFKLDVGRYPTGPEGLQALVARPEGLVRWAGPYLKKRTLPVDPWDRPYVYRVPSRHGGAYDLYSSGPDAAAGEPEGSDAVRNW